jgi:hypothetical protein
MNVTLDQIKICSSKQATENYQYYNMKLTFVQSMEASIIYYRIMAQNTH